MRANGIERTLVTGATGFIGRSLCRRLQSEGSLVRALARNPADGPWDDFVAADVGRELPPGLMEGVDAVFHLAGRAHADDDPGAHAMHREGTDRVLGAAHAAGVARFVFVSTVKAGDEPPTTAYAREKRAAEALVLAAAERMHAVVLRPALVYGPGWKGNLQRMLDAIGRGRFPPLPDVGNRRSLVHVDDVADAALLAATTSAARGGVYPLTDGEAYSTRRIYEAMRAATGRRLPRWHVPAAALRAAAVVNPAAVERLLGDAWYDNTAARRDLGWVPVHTLEESLPAIVGSGR